MPTNNMQYNVYIIIIILYILAKLIGGGTIITKLYSSNETIKSMCTCASCYLLQYLCVGIGTVYIYIYIYIYIIQLRLLSIA